MENLLSVLALSGDRARFVQFAQYCLVLCKNVHVWSWPKVKNILFVTILNTGSKKGKRKSMNRMWFRTSLLDGPEKSCEPITQRPQVGRPYLLLFKHCCFGGKWCLVFDLTRQCRQMMFDLLWQCRKRMLSYCCWVLQNIASYLFHREYAVNICGTIEWSLFISSGHPCKKQVAMGLCGASALENSITRSTVSIPMPVTVLRRSSGERRETLH